MNEKEIEKKQKKYDRVMKKVSDLLEKEKMAIVGFIHKDTGTIGLRFVENVDLNLYHAGENVNPQEEVEVKETSIIIP